MNTKSQRACGYCAKEKSCKKRAKYMNAERKPGGTKELASQCKDFTHFKK